MRTHALAAITASIALLLGVAPAADARTAKELNICWVNKAPDGVLDLEIVVDGPSYKTWSLDNGDCAAWDVRPGQYKITVEDVDQFRAAMKASCPDKKKVPSLKFTIKRQQELYRTNFRELRNNGGFTTNVRKDRRTSVTAILTCVTET
jgi:hypothetical protein